MHSDEYVTIGPMLNASDVFRSQTNGIAVTRLVYVPASSVHAVERLNLNIGACIHRQSEIYALILGYVIAFASLHR